MWLFISRDLRSRVVLGGDGAVGDDHSPFFSLSSLAEAAAAA